MKRKLVRTNWFLLWLIPIIGLLLLWQVFPILTSFGESFTNYKTGANFLAVKWVGLNNYIFTLKDPAFLEAIKNTLFFAFFGVVFKNMCALAVAQALFSIKKHSTLFRTLSFLPIVTPPMATIILFLYLYQFQYGLLNQVIASLGLSRIPWLTNIYWVKPSLIFMITWNYLGAPAIILLAGLGTIPGELREAARMDGANSWQAFWRITWPLLRRVVAFVFVTDAISWLQIFTEPYAMTQGGPVYSSLTVVMLIQRTGIARFEGGMASSLAFVLFIIILTLTLIQLRFFRTNWEY